MNAALTLAHPALQEAWSTMHLAYVAAHPGHDIVLTCVYRSPEEQAALYAKGRTAPGAIVTYCDGTAVRSKHNALPARALDFCVLVGGKISWDPAEYAPVGMLAESRGLIWGGSWETLKDYPHIELQETHT